jgi:speckle-type POZ protein
MQFTDVIFKVRGREFPAHKSILFARSEGLAAMFQYPSKEQATNQIEIEDIEPEVFQELLYFIYTGRVSTATMESMATGLLIAADKYELDELKTECENHLLRHMSPDNCVALLLHGDSLHPTEALKEAAKFFQRFPSQVMVSDEWKKINQVTPLLTCEIQLKTSSVLSKVERGYPQLLYNNNNKHVNMFSVLFQLYMIMFQ